MKIVAGVDIGNSTTEICIASVDESKAMNFLSSSQVKTTGIKGTDENIKGVITGLNAALVKIHKEITDVDVVRINEAAPVIGDTAMETITETIITESTMIGHNPSTPGGYGIGTGYTISFNNLNQCHSDRGYIVIIPEAVDYEAASRKINELLHKEINISAAIVQKDEGVLISNRISKMIPIVDEVRYIEKVPEGMFAAVEVAENGHSIKMLSNPYGIASIFNLSPEDTSRIVPVAKSLIGIKSAVVIKTPSGDVKEKIIPAGKLFINGDKYAETIDIDAGALEVMKAVEKINDIHDVYGEPGTNIGGMINNVKNTMAELTERDIKEIAIKDILAIDTFTQIKVQGGIAGETSLEKAVAIAAMVKADKLPMEKVAALLQKKTGLYVKIAGVEAVMATLGALTTPGVKLPIAILDLGGGSTDAAMLNEKGDVKSIHLAGAGEMVTMLINSELGINNRILAEEIKKNRVAKVESLFHIRMENGDVKFFEEPLEPKLFGKVVILSDKEMIAVEKDISLEKIVQVRKEAKKRIFVTNAIRALKIIAPMNNIRNIPNVVLVGGSAEDFEIPEMILQELSKYKIVAGRGNIRRQEGPRNAVATGLVLSYLNNNIL